ncbi:MAG: hypothetical protein M3O88_03005 [Actinomycetota bacterium]|nr:hypothetical protein [Actinomycetota bacterium]
MSGPRRFAVAVGLAGFTVGAVVTATSALFGREECGPGSPSLAFRPPAGIGDCAALVRSLSIRTGIAAGVATVLILLLVAGLFRTSQRIEEDRRADAIERYREGRPSE